MLKYFKENNVTLSLRQLQRDIKKLDLFLDFDKELIKTKRVNKELELQIQKNSRRIPIFQ